MNEIGVYREIYGKAALRQPILKGLRDDKSPKDCVMK